MSTRSLLLAIAVVAAGLTASGALAVEGTTSADAPMRVGPGNEFAEIGIVKADSAVTIHSCLNGQAWCLVRVSERSGWVPGDLLRIGGFSKAESYFDPTARVSLEFQIFDDELFGGGTIAKHGFPVPPFRFFELPPLSDKRLPPSFRSTIHTPGFRLHKQGFPAIIGD